MRPSQKLAIRASEIREKLSTFAGIEGELTTEQRSDLESLRTEYKDTESKMTAAPISEDVPRRNAPRHRLRRNGNARSHRAVQCCVIFDSAVEKRSLHPAPSASFNSITTWARTRYRSRFLRLAPCRPRLGRWPRISLK